MSDSSGGLVEKVAQAVYEAGGVTRPKKVWDDLGVSTRRLYAAMAAAAVQVVQDQPVVAPHHVAEEIDAYLLANHAPPIWWHISDIAHLAAGCKWDVDGGEDGFGEYDCEARARGVAVSQPSSGAGSPASSVDNPLVSGVGGYHHDH